MFIRSFTSITQKDWISDYDYNRFYRLDETEIEKIVKEMNNVVRKMNNEKVNYNQIYIDFAKEYLDYIGVGRNCFKQILFKSTKEFVIEYYVYNSNNKYIKISVPTSYLTDPDWKFKEDNKKRKNDRKQALDSLTDHQKELLKKAGII